MKKIDELLTPGVQKIGFMLSLIINLLLIWNINSGVHKVEKRVNLRMNTYEKYVDSLHKVSMKEYYIQSTICNRNLVYDLHMIAAAGKKPIERYNEYSKTLDSLTLKK